MDEWQSKQYNYAGLATMKLSVPALTSKDFCFFLVLFIMLNNWLECSYLFNYCLTDVLVYCACQKAQITLESFDEMI